MELKSVQNKISHQILKSQNQKQINVDLKLEIKRLKHNFATVQSKLTEMQPENTGEWPMYEDTIPKPKKKKTRDVRL